MGENKGRKYLVITEIERHGFASGYKRNYLDAVQLANELILMREAFGWGQIEELKSQLNHIGT